LAPTRPRRLARHSPTDEPEANDPAADERQRDEYDGEHTCRIIAASPYGFTFPHRAHAALRAISRRFFL
jgi:hypothetical protein